MAHCNELADASGGLKTRDQYNLMLRCNVQH